MAILALTPHEKRGLEWEEIFHRNLCEHRIVSAKIEALNIMRTGRVDVMIIDLSIGIYDATTLANYAGYRCPDARVIFVADTAYYADGRAFDLCSNVHAVLPISFHAKDLGALVSHYSSVAA